MEKQWPSTQSSEQEPPAAQQPKGEAGADGAQKEWREVVVQELETAKHGSPGRKFPVKAVYSKGDMKVTVFDTTPDHDVCMKISYKGRAEISDFNDQTQRVLCWPGSAQSLVRT